MENCWMTDLQERKAFTKGFKKGLLADIRNRDSVIKLIELEQAEYTRLYGESKKCARCGAKTDLTLDHIVPKAYLQAFCVDTNTEMVEGNYQLLCRLCNSHKAHRLDFSNPKTKEILSTLLEKL